MAEESQVPGPDGNGRLVDELTAMLFRLDPMGLNFETNTDEYVAEARTIALRLPGVSDLDGLREMIHQEFVRWFDADLAGDAAVYAAVAQATLAIWHRHHPLDVPAQIRVMVDYDCWPTWDDDSGQNVDPRSLPITRRLAQQLLAWATRYDDSLNRDDPTRSCLADPREFEADGRLLADLLCRELAGLCVVVYRGLA